MGSTLRPSTWLDKLQRLIDIDIDCMDPAQATRWLPFKPQDQTSNQRLVYEQMVSPENRELFVGAVREYKDQGWEAILDRISALLCAKNIANIRGRFHLQSSPRAAYDTDKIIAHARNYARELEKVGISKDRLCIKIPCTAPALIASAVLLKDGIRTLGTSVFSVEQAVAASQAGCLSISPYYNLPWYHANSTLWPDVDDPALQHPMSPRIIHMLHAYKRLHEQTGLQQPKLKPASFKSAKEAMAVAELGCHHATIPENIIQELSQLHLDATAPPETRGVRHPGFPTARLSHLAAVDALAGPDWSASLVHADIDYLADNGARLTQAIANDAIAAQALRDALEGFIDNENQSRAAIEKIMSRH